MKKTVILILALLPIVLLIVISVAGRILSTYQHIEVARVVFVDDAGEESENAAKINLKVGETQSTKIKIYPELATDKRVSYTSTDEAVCTVDAEGRVTGVRSGSASIMVRTADGNKTAKLNVIIYADGVTGVILTPETLEMKIGESKDLTVIVEPYAALNKNVTYTTSDPSVVTVSATGKVRAVGAGTATVTVITDDGGFTDTCTVTVIEDLPPLLFDFTGVVGIEQTGTGYIIAQQTFDLTAGLVIDETIALSDVRFRIIQGDGATVDENGVLTFTQPGVVIVEAFVGDAENPTHRTDVRIAWIS